MKKLWTLLLVLAFAACLISASMTVTAYAQSNVVMTVNGTEYTDHGTGWSAAVKLAKGGTDVTVKLFADWEADTEKGFICPDGGTKDGALYIKSSKITVDLNGYTINRNAPEDAINARVFYVQGGTLILNDSSEAQTGVITGGRSSEDGGAIYLHYSEFVMNGGTIKGNHSDGNGGAVSLDFDSPVFSRFTMNGGVIEENYAGQGGALNIEVQCSFTMNDGIIRNNRAHSHGGAIFGNKHIETDIGAKIKIMGGSIIDNVSEDGCGGAIYLHEYYPLVLINCTITGNSAPRGYGGAVFTNQSGNDYSLYKARIYFGGKVNITGNTAHTDRVDKISNVEVTRYIDQAMGQLSDNSGVKEEIPNVPLSKDSRIGLTFNESRNRITKTISHDEYGKITAEAAFCFTSDNPYYSIGVEYKEDGFVNMSFENIAKPIGPAAMRVETSEGIKNFHSFGKGWIYAIQQSKTKEVKLTLLEDWIGKGYFYYLDDEGFECGTRFIEGDLYISSDTKHNITIDLNGYTISRSAIDLSDVGNIFYIDTDATVAFMDSSEAKTGKITGAYNTGDGGAIYVNDGTLRLDGVEVSGNKAKYGAGVYATNLNDSSVYVLPGTRICNNTATQDGGGIYMYNGFLYVEGGEISGNTAKNGAGVYWDSRNAGCFTGGIITNNTATENGGGIYGTDWGDMYFGGTVVISGNKGMGNTSNNLYLSDNDVYVNRAAGQSDKIPNVPLVDGASIGISMSDTDGTVLISGSDSRFDSNNFGYFFGDNSSYFVRAKFDEKDSSHIHKLYYNKWGYKDAVYPKIKTVTPRENNGLISEASIDSDKQIITLKAISPDKSLFKSVVVESLVSFTTSNDNDVYWRFCDVAFDLSKPTEYKVVSKSTGTYVHCRVVVEFPDCTHNDKNGDSICDYCYECIFEGFTIVNYNKETKEAAVFVTNPGRYSLLFADYENESLKNVDIVEYDFAEGINIVPQEITSFALASGDKVMLWCDMVDLVPVCEALTIK